MAKYHNRLDALDFLTCLFCAIDQVTTNHNIFNWGLNLLTLHDAIQELRQSEYLAVFNSASFVDKVYHNPFCVQRSFVLYIWCHYVEMAVTMHSL